VKENGSVVGIERVVHKNSPVTILEKISSDSIGKIAVDTHRTIIKMMWSVGAHTSCCRGEKLL
jgi:hypothetical protein